MVSVKSLAVAQTHASILRLSLRDTITRACLPCQAAFAGFFLRLAIPPILAISLRRFLLNLSALDLPPFLPPRFQAAFMSAKLFTFIAA